MRPHQEIAFRVAYVITRNAADAEDATQDGLVKAWRALGRFRAGEPMRPWLLQIVANEARNRRRSAGRRERPRAARRRELLGGGGPLPRGGDARRGRARAPARGARAAARRRARGARLPLPAPALRGGDRRGARRRARHRQIALRAGARATEGERMNLEAELRALPIDWPQTPQFELALAQPPARAAGRSPSRSPSPAVAAALAVPESRGAILRFFHLGGVTIQVVDTLPHADERPLTAGLGPVDLDRIREARRPRAAAAAGRPAAAAPLHAGQRRLHRLRAPGAAGAPERVPGGGGVYLKKLAPATAPTSTASVDGARRALGLGRAATSSSSPASRRGSPETSSSGRPTG